MGGFRLDGFRQHFRLTLELAVLQHQSSGVLKRQPLVRAAFALQRAADPNLLRAQVFVPNAPIVLGSFLFGTQPKLLPTES